MSDFDFPDEGITGFAPPTVGDHHRGFNAALDDAVQKYADERGASDPTMLTVQLFVRVSVSNPGRIEGYAAKLGPG